MDEIKALKHAFGQAEEPTAQVRARARAGLEARLAAASRAGRPSRPRRVRVAGLTGLVAATAAAATAAAVIVSGGSTSHGQHPGRPQGVMNALTAAYVLKRAAAAELNTTRLISVDTYIRQLGGRTTTYTYVAGQRQRVVNMPGPTPNGMAPKIDLTTTIKGRTYTNTTIDYGDRVYAVITAGTMDDGRPVTISSFLPLQSNPDPAVEFSQDLRHGIITVLGDRKLHGKDAILIQINPVTPTWWAKARLCPPSPHAAPDAAATTQPAAPAPAPSPPSPPSRQGSCRPRQGMPPGPLLWLDAKTYLVIQTETFLPKSSGPDSGPGSQGYTGFFDTVTWLAPTAANLALLSEPVPADFRQVSENQMAQQYIGKYS